MKKYLTVFTTTLQEYFAYRLNMLMWRIRQIFVFLLPYFIWRSVLGHGGSLYGYDFSALITYLFGTTILRSLVMGSRTVDLGWMINSGYLTIPLLRPLNIFAFFMTRDAADKLFNLSFIFLEIPLLYFIFRPSVFVQTDPLILLLTVLSVVLAIVIYFFINIIFGSIGFWSRDVWAPRFLLLVIMEFTTGALFPLDMLPDIWQSIIFATPFPYLIYVPLKIYLQRDSLGYLHLFVQFVWVMILYITTRIIWERGLKRYEAEGR